MRENLFKEYENVFIEERVIKNEPKNFEFTFSPFALQDAIGEKSAKKIWIEYQKLRISGIEAEELVYKIAGKIRDVLAIIKGATKEDLGIAKDYPYNKSKKDSRNWKTKELEIFYSKIIDAHICSRTGGEDLDVALEKAILSI